MDLSPLRFLQPEEVLANPVPGLHEAVQVWPLLLQASEDTLSRCEAILSAPELARARRFHHEHNRTQFVFAHGLMRHVLGAHCGVVPQDLQFTQGEFGKPVLAPDAVGRRVAFNLSHSHGRALLAVSAEREVGADIEQENPSTNALGIASSYFFGPEFDAIRGAPPERRTEMFFRFWVAKEAVLKAQGTGLHIALDSFHVLFDPELRTARVETLDAGRLASGWFVRQLDCGAGWHAAVAARSPGWRMEVVRMATNA